LLANKNLSHQSLIFLPFNNESTSQIQVILSEDKKWIAFINETFEAVIYEYNENASHESGLGQEKVSFEDESGSQLQNNLLNFFTNKSVICINGQITSLHFAEANNSTYLIIGDTKSNLHFYTRKGFNWVVERHPEWQFASFHGKIMFIDSLTVERNLFIFRPIKGGILQFRLNSNHRFKYSTTNSMRNPTHMSVSSKYLVFVTTEGPRLHNAYIHAFSQKNHLTELENEVVTEDVVIVERREIDPKEKPTEIESALFKSYEQSIQDVKLIETAEKTFLILAFADNLKIYDLNNLNSEDTDTPCVEYRIPRGLNKMSVSESAIFLNTSEVSTIASLAYLGKKST
jgi:hypothetical protein